MNLIAMLLVCQMPQVDGAMESTVEVLEVSHYTQGGGYTMLIGWDYYDGHEGLHVVFWRMLDRPNMIPQQRKMRGTQWPWVVEWQDDEYTGQVQRVKAKRRLDRTLIYDAELDDLGRLHRHHRRGLPQ